MKRRLFLVLFFVTMLLLCTAVAASAGDLPAGYALSGDGVASVDNKDALEYALTVPEATSIEIVGNIIINDLGGVATCAKPVTVTGSAIFTLEGFCLEMEADFTIGENATVNILGKSVLNEPENWVDDYWGELDISVPGNFPWSADEATNEANAPKLINHGQLNIGEEGGINGDNQLTALCLFWPATYEGTGSLTRHADGEGRGGGEIWSFEMYVYAGLIDESAATVTGSHIKEGRMNESIFWNNGIRVNTQAGLRYALDYNTGYVFESIDLGFLTSGTTVTLSKDGSLQDYEGGNCYSVVEWQTLNIGCPLVVEDGVELKALNKEDEGMGSGTIKVLRDFSGSLTIKGGGRVSINGALENRGVVTVETGGQLTNEGNGWVMGEGSDNSSDPSDPPGDRQGEFIISGEFENRGNMDLNSFQVGEEGNYPSIITIKSNGWVQNQGWFNLAGNGTAVTIEAGGKLENHGNVFLEGDQSHIDVAGTFESYRYLGINGNEAKILIKAAASSEPSGFFKNDGDMDINNNAAVTLKDGSVLPIMENRGQVRINGGSVNLHGILRNWGTIENRGNFNVYGESSRIENDGCLKVDDSAIYREQGYSGLNFDATTGATAENNIEDAIQVRLGWVHSHEEDGRTVVDNYDLMDSIEDVRDARLQEINAYIGKDYFGHWTLLEEGKVTLTSKNYKYDNDDQGNYWIVDDHDDAGTKDTTEYVGIEDFDNDSRFNLHLKEWGQTRIVARVVPGQYGNFVIEAIEGGWTSEIPVNIALPYAGFFFGNEFSEDSVVQGRELGYLSGTTTLWFMKEEGFSVEELGSIEVWIDSYNEQGASNWAFHENDATDWKELEQNDHLKYKVELREKSNEYEEDRYDLLFQFREDCPAEDFNLRCNVSGADWAIDCHKPAVRAEGGVVRPGEEIDVVVRGEWCPEVTGFALQLSYNPDELTLTNLVCAGAITNATNPGIFISNLDEYTTDGIAEDIAAFNQEPTEGNKVITATWVGVDGIWSDSYFTVRFRAAATVQSADYEVALSCAAVDGVALGDGNNDSVNPILENGEVQTYKMGDVYRDNKITVQDVVQLLRAQVGRVELSEAERQASLVTVHDASEEGPNSNDAVKLLQYLAKWKSVPSLDYPAHGSEI